MILYHIMIYDHIFYSNEDLEMYLDMSVRELEMMSSNK